MEDERGAGGHSDSGGVSETPLSGKLADERVAENNRAEQVFEEGDGEEIMVEVVGSDVFVDGVIGNVEGDCEMAEAGELKGDVVEKKEEFTDVLKEGDGHKIDEVDTSLSMSIGTREKVSKPPVGGGGGFDDEACNRGIKANVASEEVGGVSPIDVSEEKESKGEVVDEDVSVLVTPKSDEKINLGEEKETLPSSDNSTSHDRAPEEKPNGNDGIEVDSINASGGEIPDSATQKDCSLRPEVECTSTDGDSGTQGKSVLENNVSAACKDSIHVSDAPTDVLDLQEKDVISAESKDSIPEPDAPTDVSDLQEKDVISAESKDSIPELDAPTDVSDLQEKDVSAAESKDSIPELDAATCLDDLHGAKLEPNDQTDRVSHDGPKSVQENSFDTPKEETVGNDECLKAEDGAEANQLTDVGDAVEADEDERLNVEVKEDVEENVQSKTSMSGSTDEEIVQSDSGICSDQPIVSTAETSNQNVVISSVKEVDGNESGENVMEIDDSVDNADAMVTEDPVPCHDPASEGVANVVGDCGSPQSTKEVVASQETEPSICEADKIEETEMMSNEVSIKPEGNGNTEPLPSSTSVSLLDGGGNEENRDNVSESREADEIMESNGFHAVKEEGDSDRIHRVDAETETEGPSSDSENSKMSNEGSLKYAGSLRMKQSGYLTPPKEEGCFAPSDLVWGKVRSHPWWPGQIFDPKDASEKAVKHYKKDSFLVAYFGDQTFAWNDAFALKPFRPYFSQIEKQSNSESFHNAVNCALEEVERRIQLGLSCSCISKDEYSKIETQVLENTGIREESSKRYGVDQSSCASCFEPNELLEFITSAATCASSGADQLDLVITRGQLSAFCSFKGCGSPIEFPSSGELLENDEDIKHIQKEGDQSRKERSLVELMGDGEYSLDDEYDSAVDHGKSSSGKKRKALDPLEGSDKRASVSAANPKPSFKIGECIRRVANQLTGATSAPVDGPPSVYEPSEKQSVVVSAESLSVNDMLSQLELLANDPKKRHTAQNQIRAFFMGFRSSIALSRRGRKKKSEQAVGGSGEEFEFDDVNDSYWTDRIVQNNDDGSLQVVPFNVEKTVKSGRKPHSRKRFSNSPTPASEFDENAKRIKQESSPAELILSFAERNRIPSEISLNKMFRRFGPLMESETEVDHESGSAKVIFKRGCDAEVARNSAEKFSIFGPVVVSYQIGYSPVISVKILPVSLPSQEEAPLMI